MIRDLDPARIDYGVVLNAAPPDRNTRAAYLAIELPFLWLRAYAASSPHQHNVLELQVDGFEYLFDRSGELVLDGTVLPTQAVEDRLVAAHGRSARSTERRNASRLRRRTMGAVDLIESARRVPYDRGHVIGHALGGGLDINIVPQSRATNRGGAWARMESYCRRNAGTYFFVRPLYVGLSSHPAEIECGVLKCDGSLWLETLKNYGTAEELEEIERLYTERVSRPSSKEEP